MYNINQQAFEKALEKEKEDSDVCIINSFHKYILLIIFILQDEDVDEYTAEEMESDIDDNEEMYDSNDEDILSDFVCSEGDDEIEDIEVFII